MSIVNKFGKISVFIATLVMVACSAGKKKNESAASSAGESSQVISYSASTVTVSESSVQSGQSVTVVVQILDDVGNPFVEQGQVVLSYGGGGTSTGSFSAPTYVGNGAYTSTFTGVVAGTPVNLSAQFNGVDLTSIAPSLQVQPGALSLAHSEVTLGAATVVSRQSVAVSLIPKDEAGNLVVSPGLVVAFSLGGAGSTGAFDSVVENSDGTYSANFTGELAGSAATIQATIGGQPVASSMPAITVVPGPISLTTSGPSGSTSGTVGVTVSLTLTLRDAAGNSNPSGTVSAIGLVKAFGTASGTFGSAVSQGNGVYLIDFTPTAAGALGILGSVNGSTTSVAIGLWFVVNP